MPENVNTSELFIEGENAIEQDDRPTMVSVDHVTMSFNMASEQLNSLKEYAIKLLKRDLFFKEFKALDDVSFEVKKGDVFGIMGTNGSGKSTILKIIAGVLDPSSGTCTVNGNIAPLIELGAGFDMDLSARENIYLNGALLGYSKEFIDQNFDAIVAFAEVEKFLDMPMKNYSSGMVARIAFAIATIIVPDILIVDEVLAVADFMFQKKCENRINELIERHGVTVLIVSHSNEQIARMCNRAIWIEKGHARLLGEAAEVCRIYGALGGRTGDKDAEDAILEALVYSSHLEDPPQNCISITGENANAVCSKQVMDAWGRDQVDTVVLACSNTHSNSVVAAAFAAYFEAPILPVDQLVIPESTESYLYTTEPKNIYVFDSEALLTEVADQLRRLPWHPEVTVLSNPKSHFDFSYDVFQYGQERGMWGSELAVVSFTDNPDAMAFAPYLSRYRIPVIFLMEQGDIAAQSEAVVNAITAISKNDSLPCDLANHLSSARLLVVGEHAARVFDTFEDFESLSKNSLEIERIAATADPGRFVDIAEQQFEALRNGSIFDESGNRDEQKRYRVCLASMTHWPELQSCGSCVSKIGAVLLLLDAVSLDSVKLGFDFLKAHAGQIEGLTFVGNSLVSSGIDERAFALQLR